MVQVVELDGLQEKVQPSQLAKLGESGHLGNEIDAGLI